VPVKIAQPGARPASPSGPHPVPRHPAPPGLAANRETEPRTGDGYDQMAQTLLAGERPGSCKVLPLKLSHRRSPTRSSDPMAKDSPVQAKVAKSRRRFRVVLRRPELPCEIGKTGRAIVRPWQVFPGRDSSRQGPVRLRERGARAKSFAPAAWIRGAAARVPWGPGGSGPGRGSSSASFRWGRAQTTPSVLQVRSRTGTGSRRGLGRSAGSWG
jgi:hypothetical protein